MSMKTDIQSAIAELATQLGTSLVYAGSTIACVPTMERSGSVLVVGGMEVTVTMSIYIDRDLMTAALMASSGELIGLMDTPLGATSGPPKMGNKVSTGPKMYRVVNIENSPCGGYVMFDLRDPRL